MFIFFYLTLDFNLAGDSMHTGEYVSNDLLIVRR